MLHRSTVSFTRPANTTAYSANQVVGTNPGSVLVFPVVNPKGCIQKLDVQTNNPANVTSYTLYLFSATFTPQNDQATKTFSGNQHFDFVTAITTGASVITSGSGTANEFITNAAFGIPYHAPDNNLYGFLTINGALTPISSQIYTIDLFVDTNNTFFNN